MEKEKVTPKLKKTKKTSVQIMEETFVMVAFAFIFGTLLSGAFLWFVTQDISKNAQADYEQEIEEDEEKIVLENEHYDSSGVTDEDYQLVDYLVELESALGKFCSGANLEPDSEVEPRCPERLEGLIPELIENIDMVGGDLSIFKYAYDKQEFEINVKLSDGAREKMSMDGGNNDGYYELGTDLKLLK